MNSRLLIVSLFMISLVKADEKPRFVQIAPGVAVANAELAAATKSSIWPSAEAIWVPNKEQAMVGLHYADTERGRTEIAAKSPRGVDMLPLLESSSSNRFQIYG